MYSASYELRLLMTLLPRQTGHSRACEHNDPGK